MTNFYIFPSFFLLFFFQIGEEKTRRNQLAGDCAMNCGYRYQDAYIPHDPSGTLPAPGFDGKRKEKNTDIISLHSTSYYI